jgi:hypothetical protein
MAFTYSLLAESTVGSGGASTITFNNIPQNYTDLVVKISSRISNANVWSDIYVRFNKITTGYTDRVVYGTGAAAASLTDTTATGIDIRTSTSANTASTFGNAEVYIPNYTSSNVKSVSIDGVSENNATSAITQLVAGIWSNISTINCIEIIGSGGDFLQHSTATLYGIRVEL